LNRRDKASDDVKDPGIKPFYDKLIGALAHDDALRDGDWRQAHVTPSQVPTNPQKSR